MKLDLNDDQFRALLQKTILDQMTTEQRDDVIAQSLAYLMTPKRDQYSGREAISPLQDAFQNAMHNAAREMISQEVKTNPQIRELITKAVTEGTTQLLTRDWSELGTKVADKIEQALLQR